MKYQGKKSSLLEKFQNIYINGIKEYYYAIIRVAFDDFYME